MLLTRKGTVLRRFGLVTTNSISQVFQRRVIERASRRKAPISTVMADPRSSVDEGDPDAAAVRIAMTVARRVAGGVLREVVYETGLDTDAPVIEFSERHGVDQSEPDSRRGSVSSSATAGERGPFVSRRLVAWLRLHRDVRRGRRSGTWKTTAMSRQAYPGLSQWPRPNIACPRGVMVIDLFGLDVGRGSRRVSRSLSARLARSVKVSQKRDREYIGGDWNMRGLQESGGYLVNREGAEASAYKFNQIHRTLEDS